MISLDDVHWADEAELGQPNSLAQDVCNDCCMFIFAYQTPKSIESSPINILTELYPGSAEHTKLHIASLNKTGIKQMLHHAFGIENDDLDFVSEMIMERSKENPFYVMETVRDGVHSGNLATASGEFRIDSEMIKSAYMEVPDVKELGRKSHSLRAVIVYTLEISVQIGGDFAVLRLELDKPEFDNPSVRLWES